MQMIPQHLWQKQHASTSFFDNCLPKGSLINLKSNFTSFNHSWFLATGDF